MSVKNNISRAHEILRSYVGDNAHILRLRRLNECGKLLLTEDGFDTEYIIKNADYRARQVNKIVAVSSDFGEIMQSKYNLEFMPTKIWIASIIGEMGASYHCYAQYRKSVPPSLMFIGKRYILTNIDHTKDDYKALDVDFSKYDAMTPGRCIKEHQKDGVKFLMSNKRCILADEPGLGKTSQAVVAALESGSRRILVITTASLKTTWQREISLYVPKDRITVIKGSVSLNSDALFTVINYDIIQRYYEVAYQQKFRDEIIVGKDGRTEKLKVPEFKVDKKTGEEIPVLVKSRKKNDIEQALKNSPLYNVDFDCVIIDEAQKLSNNTSIRYKVISDFLQKSNVPYVFLLSGTPLTNTPINLYHILRLIDAPIATDYVRYVTRYCDGKEMMKPGEWAKWKSVFEARVRTKWEEMTGRMRGECVEFIKQNAKSLTIPQGSSNLNELREAIKHLYIRRLSKDIPGMVKKTIDTRYYDLTPEQKAIYDKLWDEYVNARVDNGDESNEEYKQLIEGTLVRQFLAKEMVANTIELADEILEDGEKVIIVCNFTDEVKAFKEYYKKRCVTYDGKMTPKQKDKAEDAFMNDKKIKVFVGQEAAMSLGLTLTSARFLLFNSYSWSAADNKQAQDRIYRITQKKDATCIYQLFTDSVSQDMFEKVMRKELVMDTVINAEKDK